MLGWMRFKLNTQVGGCYYLRGAVPECLEESDFVLLVPSLERYVCIASVSRRLVEQVDRFVVTALNPAIGQACDQEVFAKNQYDARDQVARRLEGVEILHLTRWSR
jgi:hypothetical protein